MKIAFVIDGGLDINNGVQQYALTMGNELANKGHTIHYIISGEYDKNTVVNGTIHSLSTNLAVKFNKNKLQIPLPAKKRNVSDLLNELDLNILYVQMPYSPFMAGKLIKQCDNSRTSIFGMFHIIGASNLVNYGNKLLSVMQTNTLKKFDKFFMTTKATKVFAEKYFGIKNSSVSPNVINLQRYSKPHQKPASLPGKRVIFYLGRFVPRKGPLQLIRAMKILKDQGKLDSYHLYMASDGSLRKKIEEYILQNSLKKHITLLGFVSEQEKMSYLQHSDIAIFPSNGGESFGIVLIEAMAAGNCIVLAGHNEGYDVVMEGSPSQQFNANNPEDIANSILEFSEPSKINKSLQWQKSTIKQYDVKIVSNQLVEEFKNSLSKRHDKKKK